MILPFSLALSLVKELKPVLNKQAAYIAVLNMNVF